MDTLKERIDKNMVKYGFVVFSLSDNDKEILPAIMDLKKFNYKLEGNWLTVKKIFR